MESLPVLFKHECNVFCRHDILGSFQNTSLNGFYFHFTVRERTAVYYMCNTTNQWVHRYDLNGVHHLCMRAVVKVEDISRDQGRAVEVITAMLRHLNISETENREIVLRIYSKAYWLARQLEHVAEVRIPLLVDIVKVYRKAVMDPYHRVPLNQNWWDLDGDEDQDGNGDEDEDEEDEVAQVVNSSMNEHDCNPVPAARSSIEALEKVKLRPKGNCTICLGGLIKATRMPCDHMFHERCIVRWLRSNNVCPLCRFRMPAAN